MSDRRPAPSAETRSDLAQVLARGVLSGGPNRPSARLDLLGLAAVLMLIGDIGLRAIRR